MRAVKIRSTATAVLIAAVFLGCGGGTTPEDARRRDNPQFRWLVAAYRDYLSEHRGQRPSDLAAFKQYVEKYGQKYMLEKGLTIDSFFDSPRDENPYVFFTKKNRPPKGSDLVGYEQAGMNGRRYVGSSSGEIREIDQAGFDRLIAKKGK